MRRIEWLIKPALSVALLCVCAPSSWASDKKASAPAEQKALPVLYEVCRAVSGTKLTEGKYTTYLSGVMVRAQINDEVYAAAFAKFVAAKYGDNAGPECGAAGSEAEAQRIIDVTWQDNPWHQYYVKTDWTYSD